MADGADLRSVRGADRPRARDGSSETEAMIFDAMERMLEVMPLRDVRIARLLEESGVSRATFYHYFSSKWAVVSALLARVMDEIAVSFAPFVEQQNGAEPREALRQAIDAGTRVWTSHKMLFRAVHEHWDAVDELRDQWLRINALFVDRIGREIDRERQNGTAPAGLASDQLAAMLVWSSSALMFVAGTGAEPALPNEEAVAESLAELWLAAVYGPASSAA